ncbi:hypothetical protein [Pontibacillus salipaludis]|uniref:ABC transporter permease n=1 Tax=Pontibacillus salipaludis TaxID=1697394 RepID=A0ABQ1PW76_9BACI|nr:hypothetical protein [Pontibacillus salipaludis]GGD05673.1 hypothetical protein GCM10011389_11480 [Pontibacillus salipaludis]
MTAFQGLWKKEWKLSWVFHTIVISLGMLVTAIIYWWLRGKGQEPFITIPLIIILALHIFYMAGYLLFSLNKEGAKLHIWLHSPQSIHKLLGAKFLNGALFMVGSMIIFTTLLILLFFSAEELSSIFADLLKGALLANGLIFYQAILVGVFVLLLWSVYRLINQYTGKWGLLLILALAIGLMIVESWILDSGFMVTLYSSMEINVDLRELFPSIYNFVNDNYNVTEMDEIPFSYGEFVVNILFSTLYYFIAAYILDRKVEV